MNQEYAYITDDIIAILRAKLADKAAQRVFLVHGKGSYRACGAEDVMNEVCKGLSVSEFADFSVNPKDEDVQRGVQQLLDIKPDILIAVGGGSTMDIAKLIRHYAAEQQYHVPLWAIPTTAGTGAEATHFAVVYKNGVKHSVEAEDILPDAAILYPPFTYHNSAYLTACTGFDALAQAIESFWNPNATDESKQYSIRAINLLYHQLPKCINHPAETNLRDELMQGAYWAGRAINITKTTAPHAFSYAFTSKYGYPHGHAVALTFPFFMKLNGTKELFELLDISSADSMRQMEDYISSLGLSLFLKPSVDIKCTLQEVNLQRLANNPIAVTSEIVSDLERYLRHPKDNINMTNDNIPNPISVDFVPDEKLREVQKIECDILGHLLKVCQKYNLKVWAHAGTLLGAIRHRGFIPWDDDIDVVMLREDYDKLLEIGPKEFKEPYFFQSAYTDKDYIFPHAQIRRSDTTAIMPTTFRQKFNQGIFIDIFVLDAALEDNKAFEKQYKRIRRMQTLMYWRYYWYTAKKWYVRIAAYIYHIIASCFNHRKWYVKMEDILRKNQALPHKHVASIMFNAINVSEKLFPLTDFSTTFYIPYEDIEIPVPNGFHNILCRLFGDDYMTPKHVPTMHGNDIIFDPKMSYTEYIRTHSK